MPIFENILVAVDFSDFSQEAVRVASGLARAFGGKVMVLCVCDTPKGVEPALLTRHSRAIKGLMDLHKEMCKNAEEQLNDWVGRYDWGEAELTVVVDQGAPHSGIIKKAEEIGADLIVIGSHGRSGFAKRIIGSTAERVVRKSSCPVLAVTLPRI
jgi:universal stress protein A